MSSEPNNDDDFIFEPLPPISKAIGGGAPVGDGTPQEQPLAPPAGAVFSGVFDLGFAGTAAEPAQELLNSAARVAMQIEQQINDCVLRIFAGQRVTQAKCRAVISDCVRSKLNVVRDLCDNEQNCIAREMHRLMSVAWQTAAQFGCSDAPETEPLPPIGPPTFQEPPIAPQPIPPIQPPPTERPPIGPPTFPPRPPRDDRPFPPRLIQPKPPRDDKPFPPRPIIPPPVTPPIGVEPPFPQCPPDSPLECWLGLPPAPPRIVPLAPGCELTYTVLRQGNTIHIIGPRQFGNQCLNGNQWIAGAHKIFDKIGVPANARQCSVTPNPAHPSSALSCVGFHSPVQPPPPPLPPQPPGAPPTQCPVCCCCPCECPEKKPPEEKPEPEPPEEKPEGEFCCWRSLSGACYVIRVDQNPHGSADTLIACYPTQSEAQAKCDEVCAPPEPPPPPPPPGAPLATTIDWCDPNIFATAIATQLPRGLGPLGTLLHALNAPVGGPTTLQQVLSLLVALIPGASAATFPVKALQWLTERADYIDKRIGELLCVDPRLFPLHAARGLINFISKYVAENFSEIVRPLDHWSQFLCPTEIPDPTQATSAYLANAINAQQLETWVRANGFCYDPWKSVVQAQRSKPVPIELREMRRREIISPQQYDDMMRQLGYLEPTVRDKLWQITNVIPPYTDLVRMMVRDAADEALVTQFGMDTDFGLKYAGQLKTWFEHQGIPEKAAQFLWRAHWSIPSPTQLYTMFHRLARLPAGDPKRVTIQEVETALKQQDILPFWIPKLLEISFLPINRSDATQAFIHGVMNEAELKESYQQNGYNEQSADRMVAKTYQQRIRRYWRNPPVRAFIQGGLSEDDTRAALQFEGLDEASQDIVINRSRLLRQAALRRKCIDAIRKRFFAGEFDGAGAISEMINFGVDNLTALEFREFWECELKTKGKHFSASTLCGMLERGLITQLDFIARARRLGWSQDDSIILASDCLARINIRATKAAELAARRAESEARRNASQLKAALRETAAAQKREAQIIEAARKAAERREDMILRASERMANKIESTVADQVPIAKAIWQALRSNNRLMIDDALQAVVRAAEIFKPDGGFTWAELAEDYAMGTEEIEGQTNGTVME